MKQSVIYALDFDGVLCDSAIETGISGWKAGIQLWDDFTSSYPAQEILEQFCQIRPLMGTGFEAIFIIRLLFDGETVDSIMEDYSGKKEQVIDGLKLDVSFLKKLFGETRDKWIKEDLDEWVKMNPLFPGIFEKLQHLSNQGIWYIVTTKQERFVKQIFSANKIQLADDRIFGLDRNMSKVDILIDLSNKHTEKELYFVEDMLPSLLRVLKNDQLESVKLFLAPWGYNTAKDRAEAENLGIELLNFDDFLV